MRITQAPSRKRLLVLNMRRNVKPCRLLRRPVVTWWCAKRYDKMSRSVDYSGAHPNLLRHKELPRFFITIIQAPTGTRNEVTRYGRWALFRRGAILCARSVFHVLERFGFDRTVKLPIDGPRKNGLEVGNITRKVPVFGPGFRPARG
jgi:hypothetical protein